MKYKPSRKYSNKFERDYNFYINNLDKFNFCGKRDEDFLDKHGHKLVVYDVNGVTAKRAFLNYESQGIISETFEPELLLKLHKCKASIHFHIILWGSGRGDGTFPRIEWEEYAKEAGLLKWILKAVDQQMWIYRDKYGYCLLRQTNCKDGK